MKLHFRSLLALVSAVFLTIGCSKPDQIRFDIDLRYLASESKPANISELKEVRVIVGGDKFNWPIVKAGDRQTVSLYTNKNGQNELTLQYTLNGVNTTWEMKDFARGVNYKIALVINEKGVVNTPRCEPGCPR